MQTFLPYPDFEESAYALDTKRLGKQRVETLQIMTALLEERGWVNHPATKMWRGHEWSLLEYQKAVCDEWVINGGYKDTCWEKTVKLYFKHRLLSGGTTKPPAWFGNEEFHKSHMSNLIRKDPKYYGLQFPGVPDDLPYIWPV
jgi:hypothetical protein